MGLRFYPEEPAITAESTGRDREAEVTGSPAVFCPFLPRISRHVSEIQRYTVEWAVRHRLFADSQARTTFARARFANLVARAYPDASYPDLCLAVAWLTFAFTLDDHFETDLGRRPGHQREAGAALVAYLLATDAGRRAAGAATDALLGRPLAGALADVWTRTLARTGAGWRSRFVEHVGQYLAANAWEADNRVAGRAPAVEEYVRMRRHGAATAMFFDFIEVYGPTELAIEVAADPQLLALRRHADNVVAWFNDLVSWPKEHRAGDPHNLVLVLHQHGVPLRAAVEQVVATHDQEVRRFVELRDELRPALRDAPGVQHVVAGLGHWIRANVDWSGESDRYRQE